MFNINGWELAIILVLFLIVFGPDRLPEAAAQLGKLVRDLRRMADQATSDLGRELAAAADEAKQAQKELGDIGATLREAAQVTPGRGDAAGAKRASPGTIDAAAMEGQPSAADASEPADADAGGAPEDAAADRSAADTAPPADAGDAGGEPGTTPSERSR